MRNRLPTAAISGFTASALVRLSAAPFGGSRSRETLGGIPDCWVTRCDSIILVSNIAVFSDCKSINYRNLCKLKSGKFGIGSNDAQKGTEKSSCLQLSEDVI